MRGGGRVRKEEEEKRRNIRRKGGFVAEAFLSRPEKPILYFFYF